MKSLDFDGFVNLAIKVMCKFYIKVPNYYSLRLMHLDSCATRHCKTLIVGLKAQIYEEVYQRTS